MTASEALPVLEPARLPAAVVRQLREWCAEQDEGFRSWGERRVSRWTVDGESVWCVVEYEDGRRAWVTGRPGCLRQ